MHSFLLDTPAPLGGTRRGPGYTWVLRGCLGVEDSIAEPDASVWCEPAQQHPPADDASPGRWGGAGAGESFPSEEPSSKMPCDDITLEKAVAEMTALVVLGSEDG